MKSSDTKKEGTKHAKASLGDFVKQKLEIKVRDGPYTRSRHTYIYIYIYRERERDSVFVKEIGSVS
jgi:hypothetical protein